MNDNLSTRERRAALDLVLRPQTEAEHQTVDYIAAVTKLQASTLIRMLERRVRTARRAERMAVAQQVLAYWEPGPSASPDEASQMEHLASGGNPSAGTVPEGEDVRTAVSRAYDRGFGEGIADARRWQESGLDPEAWPASGDES